MLLLKKSSLAKFKTLSDVNSLDTVEEVETLKSEF